MDRAELLESLRGRRFPILDQGWVCLADLMGSDRTIVDRARGTAGTISKSDDDDRILLRRMMRKHHGSSFEFPELDIQFCCPFYSWRQTIRHRAGNMVDDASMWDEPSVNELSGRYSEVPDLIQATPPDGWRKQSRSNRQGSAGLVDSWPDGWSVSSDAAAGETVFRGEPVDGDSSVLRITGWDRLVPGEASNPGAYLSRQESALHDQIRAFYGTLLEFGVAKEQGRKVWPMGGYTIGFCKMDLRSWLSFLSLRLEPDAQAETRAYAEVIAREIVRPLYPVTYATFEDYVLNAITLSALDVAVVQSLAAGGAVEAALAAIENKTERNECRGKLQRLGVIRGAA